MSIIHIVLMDCGTLSEVNVSAVTVNGTCQNAYILPPDQDVLKDHCFYNCHNKVDYIDVFQEAGGVSMSQSRHLRDMKRG